MGRILMSGGGGVDLDVITAAADDILSGKVIVDQNGDPLTGVLTLSGNAGAGDVLTGKTFYNTNAKSKITGTMQTMSGGTYTPKSSQQTISCNGKKMTSDVIIKGDGNLTANNILYGKSIFGVNGNVRKYASKSGQVNSNNNGYVTLNPGFYVTSWILMKVEDPRDVSITVPWYPRDTLILPSMPTSTPTRNGNSITIKVTTANFTYNYYVTGYY